jgi:aromatic ring-opening dioxygenase catalytic subunit (LigB family)
VYVLRCSYCHSSNQPLPARSTTAEKRAELLSAWRQAPEAAYAHPREEHLLPLHVALGAGKGEVGKLVFADLAMGVHCNSVQWG